MSIHDIRLPCACALLVLVACDPGPDPARDDHPHGDDGSEDGGTEGDDGAGDDGAAATDEPFFLPTDEPDNTSAPVVEVDANGGIHSVYPAYAGGDAYYAYCPADCGGTEDVSVVHFTTDATNANAMLALDADGQPHVLLSTFTSVFYATCQADCTRQDAWTIAKVLDHQGAREVTGEAFTLDPQGRPRFVMHTYVAYLGIGQGAPETHFVTCDADCMDPQSWSSHRIAEQIWQSSHLRYDDAGRIRMATVATVAGENGGASQEVAAYVECDGDCTEQASWIGTPLAPAFATEYDAVAVKPTIALDLTRDGAPRIVVLSEDEAGERNLIYFACDEGCLESGWGGTILGTGSALGPGLDIALDGDDHPRFVYTFDYNIGLAHCDADRCELVDSPWTLAKVEIGAEMPADAIFLWPNCNVGAWFLHSPSLALTPSGLPRVGYQARDISGGWSNPDPTQPDCEAGTDMTFSRMALLAAPR